MRPAKAHFRAGTAVGRSKDAFAEHESESIEKHTVFVCFEGRTDWGGWGLTDRVIAVGLEFPAPCGCGPWAAGVLCDPESRGGRTEAAADVLEPNPSPITPFVPA